MLVASWNLNSIRAREERLLDWLERCDPDVVCLQELKCTAEDFPFASLQEAGYHAAVNGQKTYNGVAILAKREIDDVVAGFDDGGDDTEARVIGGTVDGTRYVSVYVVNGRRIDSDKYAFKLKWLDRLRAYVARQDLDGRLAICGDYNIAPDDRDVYDPAKFEGATHVSQPERDRLQALVEWGLTDVFRQHHDADSVYSWWDYRAGDFHQGRGLRIDLLMCSRSVAERSEWCLIDRNARKGKQPSDHAPVIVGFDMN